MWPLITCLPSDETIFILVTSPLALTSKNQKIVQTLGYRPFDNSNKFKEIYLQRSEKGAAGL